MTWIKTLPTVIWLTALLLAGWVFSRLPLATISLTIADLTWLQWLVWISLNLAIILLAVKRWQLFNQLLQLPVRFGELLMLRQAGQAISFITPGPQFGGEPLQIYWLWKRYKPPIHRLLLALGLDRFYELWINFAVLLLSVCLLLATTGTDIVNWQKLSLLLLLILIALSLLGWVILKQPKQIMVWMERLGNYWQHHPRLQKIDMQWQGFASELTGVFSEQKPSLLWAFSLSVAGWIGLLSELWLLLSFFNLNINVHAFLLILTAMRLAFLLPLPGGLGSLEAAMFWAFNLLSLPASAAVGLLALMRVRDALTLLVGLCCARGLHIKD